MNDSIDYMNIVVEDSLGIIDLQVQENIASQSCWLMKPDIVVEMFYSNIMISIAYILMPILIVYLLRLCWQFITLYTKVVAVGFVAFIVACGFTHIIKVMNFFWGLFWLEVYIDYMAGVVSLGTAALLGLVVYNMNKFIKGNPHVVELILPILEIMGISKLSLKDAKKPVVDKFEEGGHFVPFADGPDIMIENGLYIIRWKNGQLTQGTISNGWVLCVGDDTPMQMSHVEPDIEKLDLITHL